MDAPVQIMRLRDVLRAAGIGRTTLAARIKSGQFPAPIAQGNNHRLWLADEVKAYQERLRRERDEPQQRRQRDQPQPQPQREQESDAA